MDISESAERSEEAALQEQEAPESKRKGAKRRLSQKSVKSNSQEVKDVKVYVGPGVPEKLGVNPLRLIIIGHNPSEHAWSTGHFYSNPSNRMCVQRRGPVS